MLWWSSDKPYVLSENCGNCGQSSWNKATWSLVKLVSRRPYIRSFNVLILFITVIVIGASIYKTTEISTLKKLLTRNLVHSDMDFQQEILAWSILSILTLCLDFEFLIKKIQTSLGWDFARDCRSDKKVVCEWVQTTDEGFSRPLILSIHLSASKFANLDVTASRKSESFDRFCASGCSGHRDPQPLTESQSSSSILANRHYFVCCRRKKIICFVADRQTFSLWENF